MTELSQTERMALRRIINLLPAIEKQFGVGEYLDDDKIIKYVQPAQPQPVATLCETVEKLLAITDQQYCGAAIERALTDCRHALSAERKRAELVGELLEYLGFYINAEEGAVSERDYYELVRRYRALDAFDEGAENG